MNFNKDQYTYDEWCQFAQSCIEEGEYEDAQNPIVYLAFGDLYQDMNEMDKALEQY